MGSDRSLLVIAGGIAATVVGAVLIVMVLGDRPPATFPPDSPEAAVQGFLAAWNERDYDAAYGYFSPAVKGRVSLEEFRKVARDQGTYGYPPSERRRIEIEGVEVKGDRAEVDLSIEHFFDGGGPFGGGGSYQSTTTVPLVREVGTWRIDEALLGTEPGPFFPPEYKS